MYDHKEKYILDFTNVKTWIDIHAILEKEFDFPDYYGANWDAFWDCITDFIDSRGLDLEIIGLDKIYSEFKEDVDIFVDTLKDLKHIYNDKGKLPDAPNRIWYEADIDYQSGYRNTYRILYSNDGLIFVTYDHYQTFYELTE